MGPQVHCISLKVYNFNNLEYNLFDDDCILILQIQLAVFEMEIFKRYPYIF